MFSDLIANSEDFDLSFKVFHELMAQKVTDILLVSSPYEAFIMEEEGRLAERIIHEYRGLNLSRPPMLTWVSSARQALEALSRKKFDLVITMPQVDEINAYDLGRQIKDIHSELPVYLMLQDTSKHLLERKYTDRKSIDRVWVWYGNSDLLLALIKNREDQMNVAYDTRRAKVRVIILVEDSPIYCSSLLPLLYKEIVTQTQAVMEESVNDEHRILRMRARPKILLAETFEEALDLYQQYRPYLLSVFSDVRFLRDGQMDEQAGFKLLGRIRQEDPDLPLLNLSSEESNRQQARELSAMFLNKNSPTLHSEIRSYFMTYLGFGDFIFRLPIGREIARVSNLREMENILPSIPDESIYYHGQRNHFSSWLMARSEVMLASKLKPVKVSDFPNAGELNKYLVNCIHARRKGRQKGLITELVRGAYDPDADFVKVGKGSLGGKARGLAFIATQLKENPDLQKKFKDVDIQVPKSLVLSTEGFDAFVSDNDLKELATSERSDAEIADLFFKAQFPEWLQTDLKLFVAHARYPLAVRSSSLLEDAQFQPFAGIYKTYMLPNNHPDPAVRLERLITAIKLVYASTYYESPRSYAQSTFHRMEDEKMAVVIQQLTGAAYGDYFYPAISGVAQSYNFYPISHLKPDEGIAHIALGLGKTVVEGGTSLRFSPKYPQFLPQFSTVDDILKNSQRFFYALKLKNFMPNFDVDENATLAKLEIDEAADHPPIKHLTSSYSVQDHRIRDGAGNIGYPVLTFANVLKYRAFPLAEILADVLEIGRRGMGCPVEMEFAVRLPADREVRPSFDLLQIRPMGISRHQMDVEISDEDVHTAFCYSTTALGNGSSNDIADIVYVKPDAFDPARTVEIAAEISRINKQLVQQKRKYLLIGPGRWGSADRWLGIPVNWHDISGVGAIIETTIENLKADPSQGSHFFQNITSLGIGYLTTTHNGSDFIDWQWLRTLPTEAETPHLELARLETPLTIKIDGKKSRAVILAQRTPDGKNELNGGLVRT
ncbi:MAG: phosphoenolpyruvate synthase PpsA [Desulfobacterales bacterium]|nr:MAG: phosphoenolpyruvate synthase PpsA [Desulfobacterales bacterium]